ncbi:MMPL family transporter [Glutamicibacter sp. AOP12-B1-11]|uniref:MMPL family transporter n=1 Tax=Glutamicibacter sp. AOP12-B1-11 TaxID=3457725 RepID=UPI004034B923
MATFLYRLASWAHRHRFRMLSMWIAAFIAIGVCASLFMGQLSNTFTLPGTETQRTMDRMKEELPDLAGGQGTIVFREGSNRELNADQKSAIQDSLDQLALHPQVVEAMSPFELQKQLDDAKPELDNAQQELVDGQKELDDAKEQVANGKVQLADGQKKITEGWSELFDGTKEIEDAEPQIAAAEKKLAAGWNELRAGETQLNSGQAQLNDGEKKYKAGLAEYNAGFEKYQSGRSQFEAGEKQLDQAEAQLNAGEEEYRAGLDKLLDGKSRSQFDKELVAGKEQATEGLAKAEEGLKTIEPQISELESQIPGVEQALKQAEAEGDEALIREYTEKLTALQGGLAELNAAKLQATEGKAQASAALKQIDQAEAGLKQLDAARKELDAGATQAAEGRQELEASRGELASAKKQLDQAKAQLASGKQEIDANKSKLAQARAEVESGRAELNAGQAEFDKQKAAFVAGKAQLADAEKQLRESETTIKEKTKELEEGEKDIAKGEKDLESGRAELEFASRQVGASGDMRFVSEDGSTAVSQVSFRIATDALTASDREAITAIASGPQSTGVEVLFSKEILQDISEVFGTAEIIGVVIAAVVLLVMLGTLIAAGLPLLLALLGVGAGVGTTLAFSSMFTMASITPALALMLGLAVGIDYALFIIHRHRTQLLSGMEVGESIARAVGTSGNAVVFAGLTVIIALSALAVPGLPFLTVLGLSAAFTVLCSVLLNITLLPALLAMAGSKLVSKRARKKADKPVAKEPVSARWVRLVTKIAIPVSLLVVVVLGAISIPVSQMRTALPDGSAEAADSQAFQAYQQTSDKFGAGYNGPLLVLADLPADLSERQAESKSLDIADMLREYDGVVAAIPVTMTEDRSLSAIQVIPADGPASAATEALVHELRGDAQRINDATGAKIAVTGQVAAQIDVSEKVTSALPPYLAIVVGLSLILLLLVFRSVVVPLLATGGFLLSLAAAFGASVMVYQFGWMGSVFDVNVPGPLLSFLPILLTGILFGLAMDYQVFLVSAMREHYAHGLSARDAVRSGFSMAAPVVTAAALIMIAVFAGFIFSHLSMIRPLGFALATGVLFDAFVVRMTLIPAIMHLLGDKAWYLPKWLDKILPDVDVEGAKLNEMLDRKAERPLGEASAKEEVTV